MHSCIHQALEQATPVAHVLCRLGHDGGWQLLGIADEYQPLRPDTKWDQHRRLDALTRLVNDHRVETRGRGLFEQLHARRQRGEHDVRLLYQSCSLFALEARTLNLLLGKLATGVDLRLSHAPQLGQPGGHLGLPFIFKLLDALFQLFNVLLEHRLLLHQCSHGRVLRVDGATTRQQSVH